MFGLTGVLLNLSFSEWNRCHFFFLTPHSLERVFAIQIAEKLCPLSKIGPTAFFEFILKLAVPTAISRLL